MSTDFNAFFDVGFARSSDEWLRAFANAGPHVDALIAAWRKRWRVDDWVPEEPTLRISDGSVAKITGPGGFRVSVFAKAAELYHCSPWKLFLFDPAHRRSLRAACCELARLFRSDVAIYAPELTGVSVDPEGNLASVRKELESYWGAPSASLAELATNSESAPGWQYPHCYFIDRFADMTDVFDHERHHGT